MHADTYDAWNRLVTAANAYRESADDGAGGVTLQPVQTGSTVATMRYDGLGRRRSKAITNAADLDATYHDYYDDQRVVETRNGSGLTLKQYVWGLGYVDELAQVAVNGDPVADETCESEYFALTGANYNVLALVDAAGAVAERYEYAPYGQRRVYFSPGTNDPSAHAPTRISRRHSIGGVLQPYGLNAVGHQGLKHDEALGLVHNRARTLHPRLRRFMQRDPRGTTHGPRVSQNKSDLVESSLALQYKDGANLYEYEQSIVIFSLDSSGLDTYVQNRVLGGSVPREHFVSHTFIFTTREGQGGGESLEHTYSWGNTYHACGCGAWHKDHPNDVDAARQALRQKAAWEDAPWYAKPFLPDDWGNRVGDASLDPFVEQAFQDVASHPYPRQHGWRPWNNCKHEAGAILYRARELKLSSSD